jgi:two-component system NtrC family response regulator|nr:sigma-54 dependent transcriptional regulator [uncultured Prevotella sp.]
MKVLVIDDENQLRILLARIISLEGYEVLQADSINTGIKQIRQHIPDIVLCDVFLPDGNGVDMVPKLKALLPGGEIIMLTAHGNIADGVQAIKNGAYDYLTKGDDNKRIIPMLAKVSEKILMQKKLSRLQNIIEKRYTFDSITGKSAPLRLAVEMAKKVAPTDTTILLTGETGTGKEVFATAIHYASNRARASFVAVNCAALAGPLLESELFGYKAGAFTGAIKDKKGLFEQADNGTIFLDEIGEMSIDLQPKLLRVLETGEFISVGDTKTKKVNARIIAATNRNLKESVSEGKFRQDLYYRLSVFTIEIPPLRERRDDIVLLAKTFINGFSAKMNKPIKQIDAKFIQILQNYSWPGNIRELRNIIERSLIMSSNGELNAKDLPLELQMTTKDRNNWGELSAIEKAHICRILQYTNGNKTEAARIMKIGLTTLYRKIEEYGIITT